MRVALVLLSLATAGCGLKGDLYLPEEPEQPPAAESASDPAATGTEAEPAQVDEDEAP